MRQRFARLLITTVSTALLIPGIASAEGLFTPFIGVTFGGDTQKTSTTFGGALGATAGGLFGFELDVSHTPDVLGRVGVLRDTSVTTVMGNVMLGAPVGPVRPYVSGGIGLLRSKFEGPDKTFRVRSVDFGTNVGVGVMAFFTDWLGVRGDIRYFRAVNVDDVPGAVDLAAFDFLRGTFGFTFRF